MKNFRKIDLPWLEDVFPLLQNELALNDLFWEVDKRRQTYVQAHSHTQTIFLREELRTAENKHLAKSEIQEVVTTCFANAFPVTMAFLYRFAEEIDCELSRVIFARLLPFSIVYPHTDEGPYYDIRDRYHLVINSTVPSILKSGNESVKMSEGELWWFDNKQMHESENFSDTFRDNLIFDVLPRNR